MDGSQWGYLHFEVLGDTWHGQVIHAVSGLIWAEGFACWVHGAHPVLSVGSIC